MIPLEATSAYRVYIGEAVTGASAVTSVVSYALNGLYHSDLFNVVTSTAYAKNHNLGISTHILEATQADNVNGLNERFLNYLYVVSGVNSYNYYETVTGRNSLTIQTGTGWIGATISGGTGVVNTFMRLKISRGW